MKKTSVDLMITSNCLSATPCSPCWWDRDRRRSERRTELYRSIPSDKKEGEAKGQNEIDLIALNEFDHTGLVAEVKRNHDKLSPAELRRKAEMLPASDFGHYQLTMDGFSIEDM